ncbi:hypothetical protein OHB14_29895 [Streptomyces sp. NBC_01613]|uniref:hypothetical protein n=1 Tax=Streptomyces sp. NBC_01613 TaxID=2975896 RepID=UPI00386A60FE
MPRRARTTTGAAFSAAAALLLTACGGSDNSSSDDTKATDARPSSPSVSAAVSSSTPSDDVQRPVITLPSNFQLTFENWKSGDPVKQAVLNDAKEELRAGYAAIIANEPDGGTALAFYDTNTAIMQSQQWIKTYTSKNLTVFGKLPAFDPKVILSADKKAASLSYCTDESKAYTRNRKTKEVLGNPAGTDPHVSYVVSLGKNTQGVWQNVSTKGERGDCSR